MNLWHLLSAQENVLDKKMNCQCPCVPWQLKQFILLTSPREMILVHSKDKHLTTTERLTLPYFTGMMNFHGRIYQVHDGGKKEAYISEQFRWSIDF